MEIRSLISVGELARTLHEAGRTVVEQGHTVASAKFGEKTRTFIEWDDLADDAQTGRIEQARYLLDKYNIFNK